MLAPFLFGFSSVIKFLYVSPPTLHTINSTGSIMTSAFLGWCIKHVTCFRDEASRCIHVVRLSVLCKEQQFPDIILLLGLQLLLNFHPHPLVRIKDSSPATYT